MNIICPYYWKYSHLTRFLMVAPLLLSTAQGFHHTRPSSPLLIGFELQDLHQDKKGEQKRLRFAFLLFICKPKNTGALGNVGRAR